MRFADPTSDDGHAAVAVHTPRCAQVFQAGRLCAVGGHRLQGTVAGRRAATARHRTMAGARPEGPGHNQHGSGLAAHLLGSGTEHWHLGDHSTD